MICSSCKKNIEDDSLFCEFCGASVDLSVASELVEEQKANRMSAKRFLRVFKKIELRAAITAAVLVAVCGLSATALIFQNGKISDLSEQLTKKDTRISSLEGISADQSLKIVSLNRELESYKDGYFTSYKTKFGPESLSATKGYNFLVDRIAFTVDSFDSKYYHTYECDLFRRSNYFQAFNIDSAQANGYSPCPLCH